MASILVDTSAVYAIIDRDDANHGIAKSRLRSLKKQRLEPLLAEMGLSDAARTAAEELAVPRGRVYGLGLSLKRSGS